MAYDVIEKEPPSEDDGLVPLPSRWSESDKNPGIDLLADGLEARFTGPIKAHDNEAAAVRADHPMSPRCGIYYYEVTILSRGKEGYVRPGRRRRIDTDPDDYSSSIGVGFSSYAVSLTRLPGWEPDSWAYHGDDGNTFGCQENGKDFGPKFSAKDVVGCGINFRTGRCFFTKNGLSLGTYRRWL
jgi:hypothetical protein